MWGKKEKHCDRNDSADDDYGDCWDFILIDAESKLVVSLVLGPRCAELAQQVFADFYCRTDGRPPSLITSDEYAVYESVVLSTYGESCSEGCKLGSEGLPCYATVNKTREKGRVVDIQHRVVFGTDDAVDDALAQSSRSQTINTSYVERFNGTQRHFNARKARRVYTFSKELLYHFGTTWLCLCRYNFCWTPRTLRQPLPGKSRRYRQRTPAMAAGLTEYPWTLKDLLTFPLVASLHDIGMSSVPCPQKLEAA